MDISYFYYRFFGIRHVLFVFCDRKPLHLASLELFFQAQEPIFKTFSVELACSACKEAGKATDCKHMLHLVPAWQSSEKHIRLKKVMEDRPDLIASELSGLAFDSLQQCFR